MLLNEDGWLCLRVILDDKRVFGACQHTSLSLIGRQFDQGYANNGPVTADARSAIRAHKISSQIARAMNRIWFAETNSNRMTVLSLARSPAVRNTFPVPTLSM